MSSHFWLKQLSITSQFLITHKCFCISFFWLLPLLSNACEGLFNTITLPLSTLLTVQWHRSSMRLAETLIALILSVQCIFVSHTFSLSFCAVLKKYKTTSPVFTWFFFQLVIKWNYTLFKVVKLITFWGSNLFLHKKHLWASTNHQIKNHIGEKMGMEWIFLSTLTSFKRTTLLAQLRGLFNINVNAFIMHKFTKITHRQRL